jgi:hypothetical protein
MEVAVQVMAEWFAQTAHMATVVLNGTIAAQQTHIAVLGVKIHSGFVEVEDLAVVVPIQLNRLHPFQVVSRQPAQEVNVVQELRYVGKTAAVHNMDTAAIQSTTVAKAVSCHSANALKTVVEILHPVLCLPQLQGVHVVHTSLNVLQTIVARNTDTVEQVQTFVVRDANQLTAPALGVILHSQLLGLEANVDLMLPVAPRACVVRLGDIAELVWNTVVLGVR